MWYQSKIRRILSGILWHTGIFQYVGFDSVGEQAEGANARINLYGECHWNICGISPWYQIVHSDVHSTPLERIKTCIKMYNLILLLYMMNPIIKD